MMNTSLRRSGRDPLIEVGTPNKVAKKMIERLSEKAYSAYVKPNSFEKNMSEAIRGQS